MSNNVIELETSSVIGLNAIIIAVTDEVPRILTVYDVGQLSLSPLSSGQMEPIIDDKVALPFGPFDPKIHRTLELGLHNWVEKQTGLDLGYVEQLYTFGDRHRDPYERAGGPRLVSVGYIALVRQVPLSGSGEAEWHNWYDFFPWEDWREGRPIIIDNIIKPNLKHWVEHIVDSQEREINRERFSIAFGIEPAGWDFERVLERYELLYEAGMIGEAIRDSQIRAFISGQSAPDVEDKRVEIAKSLGTIMALDNRRILATALGRIRGKLKYRPVVFDLLPATFTLLQLQLVVEALGGVRLHKQNFRRLVVTGGLVEATGQRDSLSRGRPAELFRFRREAISERTASGVGLPAARF
ncbi:MAG: hypothetical protein MK031_02730 [Alphaproteobacteria bacterium]|nr:hypothetical protein [Alphaproteobacteria bacterium]